MLRYAQKPLLPQPGPCPCRPWRAIRLTHEYDDPPGKEEQTYRMRTRNEPLKGVNVAYVQARDAAKDFECPEADQSALSAINRRLHVPLVPPGPTSSVSVRKARWA